MFTYVFVLNQNFNKTLIGFKENAPTVQNNFFMTFRFLAYNLFQFEIIKRFPQPSSCLLFSLLKKNTVFTPNLVSPKLLYILLCNLKAIDII